MKIAMDGPAGAGKSTVAKRVAAARNMHYVDTGAMYRSIAYGIISGNACPSEKEAESIVKDLDIAVTYEENQQIVRVNGENVMDRIRTQAVSDAASVYAAKPYVREKLLNLQREIARTYNVVMDGRDIGTVVLPDAELKVFITADPRERAIRRAKELEERTGEPQDVDAIEAEIRERDYRDSHREIAPLKQAEDAILVDTTHMTIEEVVSAICELADKAEGSAQ